MGITFANYTIATARHAGSFGQKVLGAFGLRLSIEFSVAGWSRKEVPVPAVTLGAAPVRLLTDRPLILGWAFPERTVPFMVRELGIGGQSMLFDLSLSLQAMEALESSREGSGLDLAIEISGAVQLVHDAEPFREEVVCRITQSDWIRVLNEMDFGRVLLVEIALDSTPGEERVLPAANLVREAQTLIANGLNNEAIIACRKAVEVLNGIAKRAGAPGQIEAKTRDRTPEQRVGAIRDAIRSFASLAAHADHSFIGFDRNDAKLMLAMTAALVRFAHHGVH